MIDETGNENGSATGFAKLAGKMCKVMEALERVPKRGRNETQDYSYVTEADVLEAVRTECAKVGLAILPSVLEMTTPYQIERQNRPPIPVQRAVLALRIVDAETGFWTTIRAVGDGMDSGDKGVYKAVTGAMKYAMLKLFMVSSGDDPEHERVEHEAPPPRTGIVRRGTPSADVGRQEEPQQERGRTRRGAAGRSEGRTDPPPAAPEPEPTPEPPPAAAPEVVPEDPTQPAGPKITPDTQKLLIDAGRAVKKLGGDPARVLWTKTGCRMPGDCTEQQGQEALGAMLAEAKRLGSPGQ